MTRTRDKSREISGPFVSMSNRDLTNEYQSKSIRSMLASQKIKSLNNSNERFKLFNKSLVASSILSNQDNLFSAFNSKDNSQLFN